MEENLNTPNNPAPSLLPQPISTSPIPHKSMSPFTVMKRIIYCLFGIVCLFGIWGSVVPFLFPPTKSSLANKHTTQAISPSFTGNTKTITNKKYRYSVTYPATLAMSEETPYSTVFTIKPKPIARLVFPTLYVSVIPDGFNKKADVYNFMSPNVINKFYSMQDNQTLQTETGTNAQYWIFKRLATIPVSGVEGIVIQNNNVLEGNGLINRRILLKKNGFTYIIGSYFQSQQELNTFHDFILSFTFL